MTTPITTTKRGPYAPTRRRREQIASAVLDLVDEIGPDGVTIAAVAERCSIGEATIVYHFPTKDHILVAALDRMDALGAAAADALGPDHESFRFETLAETARDMQHHPRRVQLQLMLEGLSATPGHPAAEFFAARAELLLERYTSLLEHLQLAGRMHPGLDPRSVARQIAALWSGLTHLWVHDPAFDIGDALVDGVRRLIGANWMEAVSELREPGRGL